MTISDARSGSSSMTWIREVSVLPGEPSVSSMKKPCGGRRMPAPLLGALVQSCLGEPIDNGVAIGGRLLDLDEMAAVGNDEHPAGRG